MERASRRLSNQNRAVSEEAPPGVAGYGSHDHLLAVTVVGGRADDDCRSPLAVGLVREYESDKHDVAPLKRRRIRRPSGCPTTLPARGPRERSAPADRR